MTDRLDALRAELRTFVAEREWSQFHDPKNLAMAIASEAGELNAELRWVRNEDADAHCAGDAHDAIVDELADVLTLCFMLADRLDVDPLEAVYRKLRKTRAKYPVETTRGQPEAPGKVAK